jgi:hypothetical protein
VPSLPLAASVVVLQDPSEPDGKAVYLKEPWLDTAGCKWVKWTRNDGYIYPGTQAADATRGWGCGAVGGWVGGGWWWWVG